MNNPFTATWSRNGNLLCHGHWIITFQSKAFSLPASYQEKHLGTLGIYSIIDPEDELYREGLDEDDWIVENVDWLADCFENNQVPIEECYFRFFLSGDQSAGLALYQLCGLHVIPPNP